MPILFLNNLAKQKPSISKQQMWLFATFRIRKSGQVAKFNSTSIFQHLYFYFILKCLVIYFQCYAFQRASI